MYPRFLCAISRIYKFRRGSALAEFVLVAPFLLMVISGVLTLGDLLTQQPWLAHSTYQLAEVLATSPEESGPAVMELRRDQLIRERQARFSRFNLLPGEATPLFGTGYYGNLSSDGLRVAGVRFRIEIKTLWGFSIPTPMSLEVTAPQIVKATFVSGLATFANPPEVYDCCGVLCSAGGACSIGGGGLPEANPCAASTASSPLCGLS